MGYLVAKLLGVAERQARTMSIEVGMQNSTLGAVLAAVHFASDPLTAVPCAISACMHSLLGSSVAAVFRFRDAQGLRGAARVAPIVVSSDKGGDSPPVSIDANPV